MHAEKAVAVELGVQGHWSRMRKTIKNEAKVRRLIQ